MARDRARKVGSREFRPNRGAEGRRAAAEHARRRRRRRRDFRPISKPPADAVATAADSSSSPRGFDPVRLPATPSQLRDPLVPISSAARTIFRRRINNTFDRYRLFTALALFLSIALSLSLSTLGRSSARGVEKPGAEKKKKK